MKRFPTRDCEYFDDDRVAFIFGNLDPERALNFEQHLGECERCRGEVAVGSSDIDALMLLAPEVDPPIGFEERVLSSIAAEPSTLLQNERGQGIGELTTSCHAPVGRLSRRSRANGSRHPYRQRSRLALSMVGVVVIAIGSFVIGGSVIGRLGGSSSSPKSVTVHGRALAPLVVSLTSARSDIGSAAIYQGSTAWMIVDLTNVKDRGYVRCRLTEPDGSAVDLGRFFVARSHTSWATPLPAGWSHAREIEIVTSNGRVVATSHVKL